MRRFFALVLLATLFIPAIASAQAGATESDLRMRIARQPNDPGAYIELAKVYLDQQRYADAIRLLQSAIATIERSRVLLAEGAAPATSRLPSIQPPAAVRSATAADRPAPPGFVRVGGDVKEPKKIKHVAPVYPDIAQQSRVQGVVIVEVLVDQFGAVTDAKVLRSIPLLDQAAVDAVMQWRFTPTLLNGNPVGVVMTVTVNFSLN
jgi:TonB family protein